MRQGLIRIVFAVLATALCSSGPAGANTILDFGQSGITTTGTLSWAGGSAPLVGTDITFNTVRGVDTPAHNLVTLLCTGTCLLNFTTGALTSHIGSAFEWAGGGSFTLTGSIPVAGASGTILSGTWTTPVDGQGVGLNFFSFGSGVDSKNSNLLAYYGLSPSTIFSFDTFAFGPKTGGLFTGSLGFTTNVTSADLLNNVPEPSTILLLGSGLTSVGFFSRRRRSRKVK